MSLDKNNENREYCMDFPTYTDFVAIDWFFGCCYTPKIIEMLMQANPSLEASRLHRVYSGLPRFEDAELENLTNRVVSVSTDPTKTSTYFDMGADYLRRPLDLSVACFDSEVLTKYSIHRDKYHLGYGVSGDGWYLQDVDMNDAGQVHACICDLRRLPPDVQLYWKSHNIEPEWLPDTSLSKTAFRGISQVFVSRALFCRWPEEAELPSQVRIAFILREWESKKVSWWTLRDESLFGAVSNLLPISSHTEWTIAFKNLAKLVVEGLELKEIRKRVDFEKISYDEKDKSLTLLRCLGFSVEGLKEVSAIRNMDAHFLGKHATNRAQDVVDRYGSYRAHFTAVCQKVVEELKGIQRRLAPDDVGEAKLN